VGTASAVARRARFTAHARQIGCVLGAVAAALVAGGTMALFRWTLQVRTVPERLLESILLLVPPGVFESVLLRFSFDAKRYALDVGIVLSLAALSLIGWVALANGWSARVLVGLGIGLWLLVMLVVMPVSGAGWFASELVDGTWSADLAYLAVTLAYAGTLEVARGVLQRHERSEVARAPIAAGRRTALITSGGALAALVGAYVAQVLVLRRDLSEVRVLDPQRPVASDGADGQNSHPSTVVPRPADTQTPPGAQRTNPSAPVAQEEQIPEPRPARSMKRDDDGVVLPAGRRQGELTDLITSNDDFYIVSKNAGGDPFIEGKNWRLRVDGDVERSLELDYPTLRKLPSVETIRTLECISNFAAKCELAPFGCDLISTARWKGVRVSTILDLAGGVKAGSNVVAVIGADEYTSSLPLEALMDPDALLVYEMNGEVLPREHGYPVRLLVPDRYGMKNAKWVIGLRPMSRDFLDWYGQRKWSKDGVVKTMSRIDLPPRVGELPPGIYNVAGIAYAGARGVQQVEFSADGGTTWQAATFLEAPLARDVWVRWIGQFSLEPDVQLTLTARTTDALGVRQDQAFELPEPNGSSGWPSLDVRGQSA
jgi:DMSO/TMAO reductase YedYZ molybdopterin-dependent catalytic subunit